MLYLEDGLLCDVEIENGSIFGIVVVGYYYFVIGGCIMCFVIVLL